MDTSCNREWTRKFLKSNFTNVFIKKEYKSHIENVLYDHERSLLPATQPLVEREIRREKITNQINKTREQINKLKHELGDLQRQYFYNINQRDTPNQRNTFIRACPVDDCRGFLSSQWKCGLCENWTCPHCIEVIGVDKNSVHECNPENILTATLISRDTKSCPKCGTGIYKIEGCDQMFCTMCNTAFSWRTGQIETRIIHNPHYFEWIRRNNNTIPENNNNCENNRDLNHETIRTLNTLFLRKRDIFTENAIEINNSNKHLLTVCRNIIHLYTTIMPNYIDNREIENQLLRIRYMRNFIDEQKFKLLIQQTNKKNEKKREIHAVFQMVYDIIKDYILQFINDLRSHNWSYDISIIDNIEAILTYANECLLNISEIYDSKLISFARDASVV
jgi:hypothetical protein